MKYLVLLLLISCTSHKYHKTPSGQKRLVVTCEDSYRCHARSREVCGGNYKIMGKKKLPIDGWHLKSRLEFVVKCDEEKKGDKLVKKKEGINWFKPFEVLGEIIGTILIFI